MGDSGGRGRPGRPRRVPDTGTLSPRDQILDAAAALFVAHGFAGTSTRMIAERVGIRQASLYYHYAGKDDILADLLSSSVRPSLDRIRALEDRSAAGGTIDGGALLYAAVLIDVRTLAATSHNVGTLYLLPEIQHERFDAFRAEREDLRVTYDRLGRAASRAAGGATLGETDGLLGDLLIQLAETVIQLRRTREPRPEDAHAIAGACLRICGAESAIVERARRGAIALLEDALVN
ncbi:TetR/AcrR family transcriptional regulator [Nakamurella flava]|uniref:TetR/AcrR family transcriptional regulator n=1 Tax=Nakamurella flava TaxID=2576308 RepID=A0A4U6QME9_9ACTN|nr:TetR/AcrR family transcriptional regulator [Nakamurella flava]TKV61529.1 TetR/AcrR family transcriptional regulator [Nakamurella flava]